MTAEDRSTAHLFGSRFAYFCTTKSCMRAREIGELCEVCEEESMKTDLECPHDQQDHGICLHCGEDRDSNSDTFGQRPPCLHPRFRQKVRAVFIYAQIECELCGEQWYE